MGDGTEYDDVLLGLPGFRVTAVTEEGDELVVGIETIRQAAGCPSCGVIARTKDRLRVVVRDLPAFGTEGEARLVQASLLLSRAGLSSADLDRALRRAPGPSRALGTRRTRVHPGRRRGSTFGRLAGALARSLLGDGDERRSATTGLRSSTTRTASAKCAPSGSTRPPSSAPTPSTTRVMSPASSTSSATCSST